MKKRYHVEPCDNLGTIDNLTRDRTWDVIDRQTGSSVHSCLTRKEARKVADEYNAAGCGCAQTKDTHPTETL